MPVRGKHWLWQMWPWISSKDQAVAAEVGEIDPYDLDDVVEMVKTTAVVLGS